MRSKKKFFFFDVNQLWTLQIMPQRKKSSTQDQRQSHRKASNYSSKVFAKEKVKENRDSRSVDQTRNLSGPT